MPAITVGFAEVEQQLQRLRRRLNLVTLQHAAYVVGSVGALGAATSLVMAARAPQAPRIGVWITLGSVALTAVLTAVFCRRRWMSLQTTARFADTRSDLDDRLATLYAYRHRTQPPSRLAGILLTQTLALKPRWDVPAIAPRRFARSGYALLVSLCALALAWQLNPSSPAGSALDRDSAPTIDPHSQASDASRLPARYTQGGTTGSQSGGEKEGGSEAGAGEERGSGGARSHSAAPEGTFSREAHATSAGARSKSGERGVGDVGVPDRLQRHAPNTGGDDSPSPENHAAPGIHPTGPDRQRSADGSAGGEQLSARQPESKESKKSADTSKPRSAQQRERQTAPKSAAAQPQTSLSSGGSVAAQQTTGASSQGLLAKPQPQQGLSGQLRKFALKLTAFSSAESSQSEPQPKPKRGEVSDIGTPASNLSAPHLSERDAPDDPLHRTEIAPEHEAIVRSVFQRE